VTEYRNLIQGKQILHIPFEQSGPAQGNLWRKKSKKHYLITASNSLYNLGDERKTELSKTLFNIGVLPIIYSLDNK